MPALAHLVELLGALSWRVEPWVERDGVGADVEELGCAVENLVLVCVFDSGDDGWVEEPDWSGFAETYLDNEAQQIADKVPPAEAVTVTWRGENRLGAIQPAGFETVAFMSLTSVSVPVEMVEAINRASPHRRTLAAPDWLDLVDRLHVVQIVGNTIDKMTPRQTVWAMMACAAGHPAPR